MLLVFFVAGRQALLQHFADSVLVPHYRKVAAYITSLPGVRSLPSKDQHNLLKCKYIFTKLREGDVFSHVYLQFFLSTGVRGSACDHYLWCSWSVTAHMGPPLPHPYRYMGTLPQTCSNLVTLGQPPPPDLFKPVHYVDNISVGKWAVCIWLKFLFLGGIDPPPSGLAIDPTRISDFMSFIFKCQMLSLKI